MTEFYYNGNIEKLLYQNKADILECFEGCLLDNMLAICKNGYMAIYEHATTCNSSNYYIQFIRTGNANNKVYNDFIECMDKYSEE